MDLNLKTLGMIASVLVIASMVFIMIKTNVPTKGSSDEFKEYPSGNIEDLPDDIRDETIDTKSGLKVDERAPDFQLTTLTGESVKLSDYRGKKIILNFWASWCPPCRYEMPYMEDYYKENKGHDNVEILAVNLTTKERGNLPDKISEFVDNYKLSFPILLDADGDLLNLYRVTAYPTTYIINTEGLITAKVSTALDDKKIKKLISEIN